MKKVIFRTIAGKEGLGHIYRCISLALALKHQDKQISVIFLVNQEANTVLSSFNFKIVNSESFNTKDLEYIRSIKPEIIVFDSYLATREYLEELRQIAFLVMFDDNNDIYSEIPANLLINGNIFAKKLNYQSKFGDTVFLLGLNYLVVRPAYWDIKASNNDSKGILITTGGNDSKELMPKFMKALKDLKIKKRIIIGTFYTDNQITKIKTIGKDDEFYELIHKPRSLQNYIENSELVVSASGSTVYEVLTLKKIPVIYILAENQKFIASELEQRGVMNLGWYANIEWKALPQKIDKILKAKNEYYDKIKNLSDFFDGKGALRAATRILELKRCA